MPVPRLFGKIVVALTLIVGAALIAPAGATAAPLPATINTCHAGGGWGGTFYCASDDPEHGETWHWFPNGTKELFVVAGDDWSVWTRWSHPDGTLSTWTNYFPGGSPHVGYVLRGRPVVGISDGQAWDLAIAVYGTDGNIWTDSRAASGGWSGWHR